MENHGWEALAAALAAVIAALSAAVLMLRRRQPDPKWLLYTDLFGSWPPPFEPVVKDRTRRSDRSAT